MGTKVSVKLLHPDIDAAQSALDAAFQKLHHVESVLSLYQQGSQVNELNHLKVIKNPDPHFVQVLTRSLHWSRLSDGAFDITVQPLWRLYQEADKAGTLPSPEEISEVQKKVNWRQLKLGLRGIELKGEGSAITLNGIAQGYATDCFRRTLEESGIRHALIDCGEISTMGQNPKGSSWSVGIQNPRHADAFSAVAKVQGRCLATSGDYATHFTSDYRHHHLFDPQTGKSPQQLASVSVLAPEGIDADALSTAAFVLGPDQGMELIQGTDSIDAFFVLKNGATLKTEGFPCDM